MEVWTPGRAWHHRMCADLLRSYVRRRGWSQREVARALGVTEVYISNVFNSEPRPLAGRLIGRDQERRLFDLLGIDAEGRELLRYHLAGARRGRRPPHTEHAWMDPCEVDEACRLLRGLHEGASFAREAAAAGRAYVRLWEAAGQIVERVHPRRQPLARVEVLMRLHDAAGVLNRRDHGLGYARQALDLLEQDPPDARARERFEWARVYASRAEIVALNNLGLPRSALAVARRVEHELPGFAADRRFWLPQLYGDRLSSFGRLPGGRRFLIGEAESLRERADREAGAGGVVAVLLDDGLAQAFLAHGSPRSLRKALPLIESGLRRVEDRILGLGPLHRAQLMRTAARYAWRIGGRTETWAALLRRCLNIVGEARLAHQRAELEQEFGADEIGKLATICLG